MQLDRQKSIDQRRVDDVDVIDQLELAFEATPCDTTMQILHLTHWLFVPITSHCKRITLLGDRNIGLINARNSHIDPIFVLARSDDVVRGPVVGACCACGGFEGAEHPVKSNSRTKERGKIQGSSHVHILHLSNMGKNYQRWCVSDPLQRSPENDLGAIKVVSRGAIEEIRENNLDHTRRPISFLHLALQLRFYFIACEVGPCLMVSSKDGPTEDVCDRDPGLCDFHGEAADFLDRPSDEFLRGGCSLFLSARALAWERTAAIMA